MPLKPAPATRRSYLPATLCAVLIATPGCMVGPDYQPPPLNGPEKWLAAGAGDPARYAYGESPDLTWWDQLGDAELAALVRRTVRENQDLAEARARVRRARSLVGVARSGLLPQLGTGTSFDRVALSENFPILERFIEAGQVAPDQALYSATFDAGWEIDIFGATRREVQAAEARLSAAEAGRREVLLTVVAEAARSYFELRQRQAQAAALERNIELQRDTVTLSRKLLEAGAGSALDVERALARLRALEAALPETRAQEAMAAFRLAVLTAQDPAAVHVELAQPGKPLPAPPDLVPVGLPGEMLRRRPDVARAERRLAAASAAVGASVARLYPSFSLTSLAGVQAQSFTDLFEAQSGTWAIRPAIVWPGFQGGRLRAQTEAARADRDAALAAFKKTVLEAVAETEGALTRYARAFQTRERLEAALRHQERAVALARDAFDAGVVALFEVLEAQSRLAETEQRLTAARAEVLIALVALNKALGGGWPDRPPDQVADAS